MKSAVTENFHRTLNKNIHIKIRPATLVDFRFVKSFEKMDVSFDEFFKIFAKLASKIKLRHLREQSKLLEIFDLIKTSIKWM